MEALEQHFLVYNSAMGNFHRNEQVAPQYLPKDIYAFCEELRKCRRPCDIIDSLTRITVQLIAAVLGHRVLSFYYVSKFFRIFEKFQSLANSIYFARRLELEFFLKHIF